MGLGWEAGRAKLRQPVAVLCSQRLFWGGRWDLELTEGQGREKLWACGNKKAACADRKVLLTIVDKSMMLVSP